MSTTLSADQMLRVMDIMRRNPNAVRPARRKAKSNAKPVRMQAISDVIKANIPLVYVLEVAGQLHKLHLVDGYADTESPGAPTVRKYNAVLKALGNTAVLDENAPFQEVCKAHRAIYIRVTSSGLPLPEGTKIVSAKAEPSKADVRKQQLDATLEAEPVIKQKPNPDAVAKASPTPEEAKPVATATKKEPLSRPYVWVKNGKEERITAKQWEQRVRMCGGLDRVPLGSGEVGDAFEMVVLEENVPTEDVEFEWVDDIPVVVDIDPSSDQFVMVVQKPSPEAKAKRKAAKKAAKQEQPVVKDLTEALAILSR